jgi:murein DD-endopeptidase MepM/ murein hydrolase activator NlpD
VSGAARGAAAGLALVLLLLAALPAAADPHLRVTWTPPSPRLGDVVWVQVLGTTPRAVVEGSLGGRPLGFFPYAGGHAALGAVDLGAKTGAQPWRVGALEDRRPPLTATGRLTIRARSFPLERLTLPSHQVDLDPETERRAVAEGERLRTLYRTITPERLWRGPFTRPIGGTAPGTGFGARRVINGRPRAPHSGIDFSAPRGTPVVAANSGRVALVADFFFPGRLVALDHGLGLYTLYFHLDSVAVAAGETVSRGQVLGAVGATGRATGPHLHFGAQLGAARIDPAALLALHVLD